VWATHYAPAADLFEQQKLEREDIAWRWKPSWYIVAKADRTVHPDLQRFVAKRMGATTVETNSSHVIMLSQPDLVVDVIRKAASGALSKAA
jgi:pimeloyl-ACP methyl ester carboxylesterase